jgi:hypothetical protein
MRILLLVCTLLLTGIVNAAPKETEQKCKLVTGKLIDQRTERIADEVEVTLKNKKTGKVYAAESDENGVFKIKNVPLGTYAFHVTDKDYTDQTFTTELTEKHLKVYTYGTPIPVSLKVSWLFNWGDRKVKLANGKYFIQEHYWSHLLAKIVMVIYGLCLVLVFFYSCLQLSLAIAYVRNKKKKDVAPRPVYDPATTPKVTTTKTTKATPKK